MNIRIVFLQVILCCLTATIHAQRISTKKDLNKLHLVKETPVRLCCHHDIAYNEFSSIADWKQADKILLIPQPPQAGISENSVNIIAIDKKELKKYIQSDKPAPVSNIVRLKFIDNEKLLKITGYDGIEAAVIVGDTILFSAETTKINPNGYILRATLDSKNGSVVLQDTIPIPKPAAYYKHSNAGFESLVWLCDKKKLLAFFERNHTTDDRALLIDMVNKKYERISFINPLYFRLTDVAILNNGDMIGINHHYFGDTNEYKFYVDSSKPNKAKAQMQGLDPRNISYTAIVNIQFTDANHLSWKTLQTISYANDNWEGILPFDNGVLMVVDGVPPGAPCRLSYFKLKK